MNLFQNASDPLAGNTADLYNGLTANWGRRIGICVPATSFGLCRVICRGGRMDRNSFG